MTAIIEIARLRTRPGVTRGEFLEANRRFAREAVPHLDGLERRELLAVGDDDEYVVVVRFTSRAHFEQAPNASRDYPAARALMDTIDPDSLTLELHEILS